jgi:hypothetical protein
MSRERSVFFDEWQACLRSHYVHVIRSQDEVTEPTLRHVLLQTGLTQAELEALWEDANYIAPSMVEESAADINPEEAVVEAAAEPVEEPLPAEVIEVVAAEAEKSTAELIVETGAVGDGVMIVPEVEAPVSDAAEAVEDMPPEETPPPDVRQLSMF